MVLNGIIKKVRRLVSMFKRSPTKNDLLQKYVVQEHGKELVLLLDSKTRWNSLLAMLERFNLLKNSIRKALIDISCEIDLSDSEWDAIITIISSLAPVNAAVNTLCERNANLLTADSTISYMLNNIKGNDPFSKRLKDVLLTRILERRTNLSAVLNYLHFGKNQPKNYPFPKVSQQIISKVISDVLERLANADICSDSDLSCSDEHIEVVDSLLSISEINKKLHDEINNHLNSNVTESIKIIDVKKKSLKMEMMMFEQSGSRGPLLSLAYEYLLTVKPTSVESERAFSATTYICSKLRTRLGDVSVDHLCFLRAYFQNIIP